MTRRIQNIDMHAGVVKGEHGRRNGDATLLFKFHPIGRRQLLSIASGTNRTRLLNLSGKEQ